MPSQIDVEFYNCLIKQIKDIINLIIYKIDALEEYSSSVNKPAKNTGSKAKAPLKNRAYFMYRLLIYMNMKTTIPKTKIYDLMAYATGTHPSYMKDVLLPIIRYFEQISSENPYEKNPIQYLTREDIEEMLDLLIGIGKDDIAEFFRDDLEII